MEKRYQVFISSTYKDLIDERIEVIQALLELDCIPVGMEYFPAADESQWNFIKKLIDESDYYIVIIAGKYGSEDEKGKSYTQKEYEYAVKKGIPIISFLHKDLDSLKANKIETDSIKRKKLEDFRSLVQKKLCKFWMTSQDLGAVVSRSMSQAKKKYPRTGWVRADSLNETSEKEIIQLYKKIENLENQLEKSRSIITEDIDNLADGEDEICLDTTLIHGYHDNRSIEKKSINFSWNEISYFVFPKLIDPIKESSLKMNIRNSIINIYEKKSEKPVDIAYATKFTYEESFYDSFKIQMQLLAYINFFEELNEETGKKIKYATLTHKGHEKLIKLRAVVKN